MKRLGKADLNTMSWARQVKRIDDWLRMVAIAFACWSGLLAAAPEEVLTGPKPPNVLFILVDDLGWADLGCYGSKGYRTSKIDRLAKEGMRFTDFYAGGPVCSPTRASILTGKSPARVRITRHLLYPKADPPTMVDHLALEEETIAEAFKEAGYTTGYFGKWHLGYEAKHWAGEQGFDVAKGGMDLAWAWKLCHPDKKAPPMDRVKDKHTRFFSPHHLTWLENGPDGEYLTERLTNETISFIEKNREGPFFAFLSFHTVHTPLQAKPEVIEDCRKHLESLGLLAKKDPGRKFKTMQNLPEYAAMVQHLDENVGRLLERLDALGLREETLVVFTSDNGGKGSVTSNLPLAGAKHDLREGGIRVPLIIRWPGRVDEGSECGVPLISHDFYPTLLRLCGLPERPTQHVDGRNFAGLLGGAEVGGLAERPLCWHYPHSRMEGAVRVGDYKLSLFYKTGETRLYNLAKDIGETKDLSQQEPERVKAMRSIFIEWLKASEAQFPEGIAIPEK